MHRWSRLVACIVPACVLVLAACAHDERPALQGYIEGEYVRVAAPVGGRLDVLAVQRGDRVEPGSPLFALEAAREAAAVSEAQERVARTEATLADLQSGRRAPEVAVLQAQLRRAEAAATLSRQERQRFRELHARGLASAQQRDIADSRAAADAAAVVEQQRQIEVARLPAREDQQDAAAAEVEAARAALAQAQWQLAQRSHQATVAARVEEVYFQRGEWVPPATPVVSLLPPDRLLLRFFVPQPELGRIAIGDPVQFACDGCAEDLRATIAFVANQAEFTPPVLYDRDSRAKLVYRVEAHIPAELATNLHPGQPVDVVLP